MMASHMAMPREGHLQAVLNLFAFLRKKYNSRMVFRPTYPAINMSDFKQCKWKELYGKLKEAIPSNAPEERVKEVDLRGYVDIDHAGENKTRRYRFGFFIFLNTPIIQWFSNKKATIETYMFGEEFVAMKIVMETLRGIRYNLRIMGVPIYGPSYIYGNNMQVIHNTQRPESTLKKKSNSIFYHAIRESVAMGDSLNEHVGTNINCADLATKVLYGGKRRFHMSNFVYNIYDDL